jgi:hypothetical protein
MSGLEIAGIVLGSLPLIISAVEHYATLARTVRSAVKYKTELKILKHDLDAECIIFLDTLERVLDGLVPARQFEELLKNPASALWQDATLNQHLRDRLGRSYSVFSHSVNEMNAVIREFMNRLDLDDQGKVQWTESTGLRLAIKRAGFSLRKRDFDDLVERLRKHNRYLEKFTNRSIEFEPSRRVRKQSSKLQNLGKYAKSVFDALEASFGCDCRGSDRHTALLGLDRQSLHSALQSDEQQEKLRFKIVVSGALTGNTSPPNKPTVWQEMSLESIEDNVGRDSQHQDVKCSILTSGSPLKSPDGTNKQTRKSVRFFRASRTQISTTLEQNSPVAFTPNTSISDLSSKLSAVTLQPRAIDVHVSSMCKTVCTPPASAHSNCLGYIVDGDRKFFLFPQKRSPTSGKDCWSTVTLGQVLQKTVVSAPPLTPWDRLTLAATVASAVLQLHASPWLKSAWSNEDVLFLQREGERLYQHAFVAKLVPDAGKAAVRSSNPVIFNETLLALAIVLVELSLGPLEKLQTPDDLRAGIYANMVTLWRLVEDNAIGVVFGPKYQAAVRRCIELAKTSQSLDEQVHQDLYEGVVSILEDQAARRHLAP